MKFPLRKSDYLTIYTAIIDGHSDLLQLFVKMNPTSGICPECLRENFGHMAGCPVMEEARKQLRSIWDMRAKQIIGM
jgi:hypothetical protein